MSQVNLSKSNQEFLNSHIITTQSLKQSFRLGIMLYVMFGTFIAGIWTLIPTKYLAWGAHKTNLVGYISHCSFSPLSSLALFGLSIRHFIKIEWGNANTIAFRIMLASMLLGYGTGLLSGITIGTFIVSLVVAGIGYLISIFAQIVQTNQRKTP